jgi:hypothetical protein
MVETKPEKPNITTKHISKPSVAIVVETHFQLDTTTIDVDNQMTITHVQVGKNIVEDVLIDGGANVNIVIENFITKLGLPKLRPAPYHLRMENQSMTRPLRIIRNLKIRVHGIPYITTFIVMKKMW